MVPQFPSFELIIAFLLGAIIGSFANVCIYRLPSRQSLVFPGSHLSGRPFVEHHTIPRTDGASGVRVLRVLQACQQSLEERGAVVPLHKTTSFLPAPASDPQPYYVHPTSTVDKPSSIGRGTRIWHYSHIMPEAQIGESCIVGQNVLIGSGVTVGDRVKIRIADPAESRLAARIFQHQRVPQGWTFYPASMIGAPRYPRRFPRLS